MAQEFGTLGNLTVARAMMLENCGAWGGEHWFFFTGGVAGGWELGGSYRLRLGIWEMTLKKSEGLALNKTSEDTFFVYLRQVLWVSSWGFRMFYYYCFYLNSFFPNA